MRDATFVGLGDPVDRRREERESLLHGSGLVALTPAPREFGSERLAVEPLPNAIGHGRTGPGRDRPSGRNRLRDGKVGASEAVMQPSRVLERLDHRPRQLRIERIGKVEALDRHRGVDLKMVPLVDDAQLAVADERVDAELPVEDTTD